MDKAVTTSPLSGTPQSFPPRPPLINPVQSYSIYVTVLPLTITVGTVELPTALGTNRARKAERNTSGQTKKSKNQR